MKKSEGLINIPNAITSCNLISGCIATYFAFEGYAALALLFIVIGAVFDFFDGMSARLMKISSPIGKELDSLADDITFGFAPSAMIFNYLITAETSCSQSLCCPMIPASLAFVMAAFSALRLAKFNLDERQAMGFIGLPTPANALFWGALLVGAGDIISTIPYSEIIILLGTFVSSYLLISEIPMFALKFKHWGWKGNEVKYVFVITSALFIACPLIMTGSVIGISAVIAWYIVLSVATRSHS